MGKNKNRQNEAAQEAPAIDAEAQEAIVAPALDSKARHGRYQICRQEAIRRLIDENRASYEVHLAATLKEGGLGDSAPRAKGNAFAKIAGKA